MNTKAIRLHGAMDMRYAEFELPPVGADEVMIKVVTDSLCASTYKAVKQGSNHKRVPNDIEENPIIIGHELCGEIVEVALEEALPAPIVQFVTGNVLPGCGMDDAKKLTKMMLMAYGK